MTKPDKPTARNQKYVCTDLGKQIIEQQDYDNDVLVNVLVKRVEKQ